MRNEIVQSSPPTQENPHRKGRTVDQWLNDIERRLDAMEEELREKLRRKLEGMKRERTAR